MLQMLNFQMWLVARFIKCLRQIFYLFSQGFAFMFQKRYVSSSADCNCVPTLFVQWPCEQVRLVVVQLCHEKQQVFGID
eukprot:TRINITY_DN2998_c0_g2_i1.p2 TRINITY_DN2998_c0_g2~~TRINITY_DN2998_c0_g2_i1.p2  ORF type:complete len:79 (-),score=14.29 TRINITY_DN2998_c0_g2_i1:80-316(-)